MDDNEKKHFHRNYMDDQHVTPPVCIPLSWHIFCTTIPLSKSIKEDSQDLPSDSSKSNSASFDRISSGKSIAVLYERQEGKGTYKEGF